MNKLRLFLMFQYLSYRSLFTERLGAEVIHAYFEKKEQELKQLNKRQGGNNA